MRTVSLKRLLPLLLILALSGCAGLSLKASPLPESEEGKVLRAASAELRPDDEGLFPFNHTYHSDYCAKEAATQVYIAPVDTSRVDLETVRESFLDADDVVELAAYARERLEDAFAERSGRFQVVSEPPARGRIIELAVVELSGTEVVRNVLGTALGAFVPGGGLIAIRSSGTIGIEGVVREAQTGKPLFVFADRERGKTAPFSFNDFRVLSHARAAIDDWSEQIVESCAATPGTRIADSSPITLLPL